MTPEQELSHYKALCEELREALERLERAGLRIAQLVNHARRDEATVSDWDAARQELDAARNGARKALAPK